MFGWFNKPQANKGKSPSSGKDQPQSASTQKTQGAGGVNRDDIIRQAMENTRAAREAIGPENLDRIMQMMEAKKKQSEFAKAREILQKLDNTRLADNFKYMMNEDSSHPDPRRNAGRTPDKDKSK